MAVSDLAAQFLAGFPDDMPSPLGLAVSGGGDSIAMLHLARGLGVSLRAVTVDHGLREASAQEAEFVSKTCADLGVPHDVLIWTGWDGQGNLQAAARAARYGLIAEWAAQNGVPAVALGHTMEDQAETFLMRLARGSGVDGLSAMRADFQAQGQRWLRPMLSLRRADLRAYLTEHALRWVDDPSNEDTRFDRVRMRQAMGLLSDLGLDTQTLSDTSQRLSVAREALQAAAITLALQSCQEWAGTVAIDAEKLQGAPQETHLRLIAAILGFVSGAAYRPRLEALRTTLTATLGGEARSLNGCLLHPKDGQLLIFRECNAVRETRAMPGQIWDGRWQLTGPAQSDMHIAALGEEGLKHCPDWRETRLPHAAILATPAVWQNTRLIAAPLAGLANGWHANLIEPRSSLIHYLNSH